MAGQFAPRWISSVARSGWFAAFARIALTTAYWWGGVSKLLDFPSAIREMQHFGIEPAPAIAGAVIVLEVGGSVLIIAGRAVWLAAGALAVFTAAATLLAHSFWAYPAAEQFREFNSFLEHIGLIGGFLLAIAMAEEAAHD